MNVFGYDYFIFPRHEYYIHRTSPIINAVIVINLKVKCEYNKRDVIKKLNVCLYAIKKSKLTVKGFEPISPINRGYCKKYKK